MHPMHSKALQWMKDNVNDNDDEFDLAANCCSDLNLWEEDYSIPYWVSKMAEKLFDPLLTIG